MSGSRLLRRLQRSRRKRGHFSKMRSTWLNMRSSRCDQRVEEMPEWLRKVAIAATISGLAFTAVGTGMEHAAEEAGGLGHSFEVGAKGAHEYGGALYYLYHGFEIISKPFEWVGKKLFELAKLYKHAQGTLLEFGFAATRTATIMHLWDVFMETRLVRTTLTGNSNDYDTW